MPFLCSYFNSNMVRLKDVGSIITFAHSKFQFQYGAIKSRAIREIQPLWVDFNSNMVRLKDYAGKTPPEQS